MTDKITPELSEKELDIIIDSIAFSIDDGHWPNLFEGDLDFRDELFKRLITIRKDAGWGI